MSQSTQQTNHSSANAEDVRYFNEYANGIGYVNSLREFGGNGQLVRHAAQVSVIQGLADNVHYEPHDLVIASDTVLGVLTKHRAYIESEDAKVLIRFNMTNPRAKAFTYKTGERAGETGTVISGFLTRILSLKVNGKLVYENQRTFDQAGDQAETAHG